MIVHDCRMNGNPESHQAVWLLYGTRLYYKLFMADNKVIHKLDGFYCIQDSDS